MFIVRLDHSLNINANVYIYSTVDGLYSLRKFDRVQAEFLRSEARGNLRIALDHHTSQAEEFVRVHHKFNIDVLPEWEDIPEALQVPTRMEMLDNIKIISYDFDVSLSIAALYLMQHQWSLQPAVDQLVW